MIAQPRNLASRIARLEAAADVVAGPIGVQPRLNITVLSEQGGPLVGYRVVKGAAARDVLRQRGEPDAVLRERALGINGREGIVAVVHELRAPSVQP